VDGFAGAIFSLDEIWCAQYPHRTEPAVSSCEGENLAIPKQVETLGLEMPAASGWGEVKVCLTLEPQHSFQSNPIELQPV
jgi:hypothetical protein